MAFTADDKPARRIPRHSVHACSMPDSELRWEVHRCSQGALEVPTKGARSTLQSCTGRPHHQCLCNNAQPSIALPSPCTSTVPRRGRWAPTNRTGGASHGSWATSKPVPARTRRSKPTYRSSLHLDGRVILYLPSLYLGGILAIMSNCFIRYYYLLFNCLPSIQMIKVQICWTY